MPRPLALLASHHTKRKKARCTQYLKPRVSHEALCFSQPGTCLSAPLESQLSSEPRALAHRVVCTQQPSLLCLGQRVPAAASGQGRERMQPWIGPSSPRRKQEAPTQSDEELRSLCAALLQGVAHYRSVGVLGSGNSGVVLRALDTRHAPPLEVALKLMPRGDFVREYRTYLKREIVHTASIVHPAIITLREAFLTPTHLGIAMEYARGGDLQRYLNTRPGCRVPEGQARWLFQQLALGLQYCHGRGVANRDLKLENLLLDNAAVPRPLLKICDFGYSKHEANSSAKSGVGTTAYMPPEVVLGSYSSYNAKAMDVWAAGVVLYVMLCGAYPFDPGSPHFARRVVAADYPPPREGEVSGPARDLLARMLHPQAELRATMDDVVAHPWVQQDLPSGAATMNEVLARHAARSAALDADRGRDMAVAVHRMVEQAVDIGQAGEPPITVAL